MRHAAQAPPLLCHLAPGSAPYSRRLHLRGQRTCTSAHTARHVRKSEVLEPRRPRPHGHALRTRVARSQPLQGSCLSDSCAVLGALEPSPAPPTPRRASVFANPARAAGDASMLKMAQALSLSRALGARVRCAHCAPPTVGCQEDVCCVAVCVAARVAPAPSCRFRLCRAVLLPSFLLFVIAHACLSLFSTRSRLFVSASRQVYCEHTSVLRARKCVCKEGMN